MTMDEEDDPQELQFISSGDEVNSSDSHLVAKMNADGQVTGYRTGRSVDGRDSGADLTDEGMVVAHTAGPPPATDDRELRTGQALVNHLNSQGGQWKPAELTCGGRDEDGVDCTADSETGSGRLLIQVTMADRTAATWKQLRQTQTATHPETPVEALVEALKAAIESKNLHPKEGIHLALDATDSISSALPAVTDAFRAMHGTLAGSLGYEGIYLVGPEGLVTRLDESG
ncbi:hypothetical protein [Streptomyces lincolnensis]|uniref:hypothetical protein n=1 Tax=Streptomyces lincolnensis TaxID=1915 RepID=UPI0037CD8CC9